MSGTTRSSDAAVCMSGSVEFAVSYSAADAISAAESVQEGPLNANHFLPPDVLEAIAALR